MNRIYFSVCRHALIALAVMLLCVSCPPSEPDPFTGQEIGEKVFSPNAQRLMNYLKDQYGEKIISGQMDTAWTTNDQMDMIARVYNDTGKYPAIKGFDMMELPNSWSNFGRQQIDEAIEWWDGKNNDTALLPDKPDIHGIVTFCWHWRRPAATGTGMVFYTRETNFRIPWKDDQLDTESADFKSLKKDLDDVAALLQLLKDKDIPVLWRPLHEAAGDANYPNSGGWFWWGAYGGQTGISKAEAGARYIALWEYMYVYLAETKKLTNLIWVWNGQDREWFPNPDSVDIVGYDVYTNANSPQTAQDYSSQQPRFNQTKSMIPSENRGNIMVAMTENGTFPDPDNCVRDNAMWSWFCTWNDNRANSWLSANPWNPDSPSNYKECFWSGEYHNTQAHKTHVYNHEKVITLDELSDLTKYRLE